MSTKRKNSEYNIPKTITLVESVNDRVLDSDGSVLTLGKVIVDNGIKTTKETVTTTDLDAVITKLKNSGFRLTVVKNSKDNKKYENGAYYWICKVEQVGTDITFAIQVSRRNMQELMINNTFVNGACSSELVFFTKGNRLGLVSVNQIKSKNTVETSVDTDNKWIRCRTYEKEDRYGYRSLVYLADLRRPLSIEVDVDNAIVYYNLDPDRVYRYILPSQRFEMMDPSMRMSAAVTNFNLRFFNKKEYFYEKFPSGFKEGCIYFPVRIVDKLLKDYIKTLSTTTVVGNYTDYLENVLTSLIDVNNITTDKSKSIKANIDKTVRNAYTGYKHIIRYGGNKAITCYNYKAALDSILTLVGAHERYRISRG